MFNKDRYNGIIRDEEDKTLRILITTPVRDLLDSLSALLSLSGWEADTAHDGAGAIRKTRGAKYDVALIDEATPMIRAKDLIRELCESGTPSILMTDGDEEGGAVLRYPFTPEELFSAIEKAKEKKGDE